MWLNITIFFFKQKTAYEMRISDWSSDVCSSDLHLGLFEQADRARGVDQRQILRGRDDHRAGGLVALDHGELDVAGARRQIDDERVDVAPARVDQLFERLARQDRKSTRLNSSH